MTFSICGKLIREAGTILENILDHKICGLKKIILRTLLLLMEKRLLIMKKQNLILRKLLKKVESLVVTTH